MGTRNLTKVIYEGKTIIAQYGQWDGYPEGQGTTIFYTLQNKATVEDFIKNIKNIFYPVQEQLEEYSAPFMDGTQPGWMTLESGKAFSEKYPSLSRDTGGEIIRVVADSGNGLVPMVLDLEFENDTLMCEAVYTVDLDNQTFRSQYNRQWEVDKDGYGDWLSDITLTFDHLRLMSVEEYHELFRLEVNA